MRRINIHKTRMTTTLKSEAIRSEFDYRDIVRVVLVINHMNRIIISYKKLFSKK